jgi:hypothetical protein
MLTDDDKQFITHTVRRGILAYCGFWGAMVALLHIGLIIRSRLKGR